jgi:hypothetical protein
MSRYSLGSAAGPFVAGYLFGVTGDYQLAFLACAVSTEPRLYGPDFTPVQSDPDANPVGDETFPSLSGK